MPGRRNRTLFYGWVTVAVLTALFIYLISDMNIWRVVLKGIFPDQPEFVYPRATLVELVEQHLVLVLVSSLLAVIIGVGLGIYVTRPSGKIYQPALDDLTSLAQTFPPVAVLALVVPFMGFGFRPAVLALFLYSILPITRNTISGIQSVPSELIEVASGMGMSRLKILLRVELPLATKMIMAGIRTSVVINIGTATLGAVVGAGGLGTPIVSGLVRENVAFVIEGAAAAALLAFVADRLLAQIEASLFNIPETRAE